MGCSDRRRTLAWPPEFEFTRQGDELRVVGGFGRGETWRLRLGETVSFGGGEVRGLQGADAYTTFRVPADCPGPYWMFGGN